MKKYLLKSLRLVIYLTLLVLFSCISRDSKLIKADDGSRDLAQILTEGKIVAVTNFESLNFFIYKGEPMGFQYEMLLSLAKNLGVKLELISEKDSKESIKMLKSGEVDIVACNFGCNSTLDKTIARTIPHRSTRQVLIQRKDFGEIGEFKSQFITNPRDLAGKEIFINKGSLAELVVKEFSKQTNSEIKILEKSLDDADQLFDLVSSGKADYAVCDEDIAKIYASIYSNTDISTQIGDEQAVSWLISSKSPDLQRKINEWLTNYTASNEFRNLSAKYFENPYIPVMVKSDFFYTNKGRISMFDEQIKAESRKINWDWRLLASLIYQESKFNPYVRSESGAYGLMQFMPNTAQYMGIEHESNPSTQLIMGVRYLKMLEKSMEDIKIPEEERLKFVLAAYNAGYGHIIDARNLARKFGKDPNKWDNNVGFFIQNKTEFYNDTVVRYGYLRGRETYQYVADILERYERYKNIVKE